MSRRAKKLGNRQEIVVIDKLVHGGQGLGLTEQGKKVFVWCALPSEKVMVQITKDKKSHLEGVTIAVIQPSADRIEPEEPDIFLATSPWQIIDFSQEAIYKQQILAETFEREGLGVHWAGFYQPEQPFGYRNKMEYNFWFDKDTEAVSLALHKRGTHQKIAVIGSLLATEAINEAGQALINYINDQGIEARPLKSVILRSDQNGQVGISLFVNEKNIATDFENFSHPNSIFEIIYSNPKSPASVTSEVIKSPSQTLADNVLGRKFEYSNRSFFQVNIPVYEKVLEKIFQEIKNQNTEAILDLYSGVGSIGLSVVGDEQKLTMVETEPESTAQATQNMAGRSNCQVITASAEQVLDYITGREIVIVDPPRAGLHKKVIEKLVASKPPKIIYLSCNPSTQARDIKFLVDAGYKIIFAQGFNFFPRTPHIESLIVLKI